MPAVGSPLGANAQSHPQPVATERETKPGEGVLCAWVIFKVTADVGRRCFPNDDPEFQVELQTLVADFDAYVAKNARDPALIQKFLTQQYRTDAPVELLCRREMAEMYRFMAKRGPAALRDVRAKGLSRPGEPTLGDCT